MKYEIYKDKQGLWRWRVIARNGRIIAESGEGYTRKNRCLDGFESLAYGIINDLEHTVQLSPKESEFYDAMKKKWIKE
jgi:uncharacterized protein YegP (UPF0339 family)